MRILRPFIRTSIALALPMAAHAQTQEGTFPHWNGPSAGLSLGRGWGTNEAAVRPGADEWSQSFSTPAFDAGRIPSTPEVPVKGTFFSVQGGYDLRLGNFVVGAAGDIQLGRRSGNHTLNLPAKPRDANTYWVDVTTTTTQQVNRTASLRARLGVIGNEQWMAYLTGGLVHAGLKHRYTMNADDSRDHQTVDSKASAFGLLLGGGLEVPIKDRYRARLEYRYMDLGEQAYRSTATGRPDNLRAHHEVTFRDRHHELMLGVVYALGQPRPSAPAAKREHTRTSKAVETGEAEAVPAPTAPPTETPQEETPAPPTEDPIAEEPEPVLPAEQDTLPKEPNTDVIQKPGVRVTVGGFAAVDLQYEKRNHPPVYGTHIGILIPVGKHLDIVGMGEYFTLSESEREGSYPIYPLVTPGSEFATFQAGVRLYARPNRRTGLYMGVNAGITHGWHSRTILTMPEQWPTNEPIPYESMVHTKQPFQRWYGGGAYELGWTFSFRADLAINYQPLFEFHTGDLHTDMVKARLSVTLGKLGKPSRP